MRASRIAYDARYGGKFQRFSSEVYLPSEGVDRAFKRKCGARGFFLDEENSSGRQEKGDEISRI